MFVDDPNLAVSRQTETQVFPECNLIKIKVRILTNGIIKPLTSTTFIVCKPENDIPKIKP